MLTRFSSCGAFIGRYFLGMSFCTSGLRLSRSTATVTVKLLHADINCLNYALATARSSRVAAFIRYFIATREISKFVTVRRFDNDVASLIMLR